MFFLYSCQRLKYLIQPTKNDFWFENSLEEGVWLIINYIIEEKLKLPDKKNQLYQYGKL